MLAACARMNSVFTPARDAALVKFAALTARTNGGKSGRTLLTLSPTRLTLTDDTALQFPQLVGLPNDALRIRFAVLALFNR